jgi:hypothetical protein
VGGDDDLATLLRRIQMTNDRTCDVLAIEVVLGLIQYQRLVPLRAQEQTEKNGSLLTGREFVEWLRSLLPLRCTSIRGRSSRTIVSNSKICGQVRTLPRLSRKPKAWGRDKSRPPPRWDGRDRSDRRFSGAENPDADRRIGRRYHDRMATTQKASVEIEADLLKRARRAARERGVAVPQLVREALEHELGGSAPEPGQTSPSKDEGEQPPLTCIGAFNSGRGDLSKLASEDVFEPEPFR